MTDLDLTKVDNILDNMTEDEKMKYAMIKASNMIEVTRKELFNVFYEYGLIGIYNLGMAHMYQYLKGDYDEETI